MKKVTSLLLALVLALSLTLPAAAAEAAESAVLSGGVTEIQKYGNIILDIPSEDLLEAGYEYGDLVTVTVSGTDHEMPLCTNYSDVDVGSLVLRDADGALIVAINMGDFATTNSLAAKETAEDGTYEWVFEEGKSIEDITVSIAMAEKGGYHDQYLIHQLERTNERDDYDSDQIFANFRNIAAGELGENALFRSSSPVNNELGRAAYADKFVQASGIQAVMNLADASEDIEGYFEEEDFASPYYQSLYDAGKVKALNLGVDFTAESFQSGLAEGLRFFAANEGPYLVHCTEGKDRAGFVSALLACFMGASLDEVVDDYMTTYANYYHLEEGSEQYEAVKSSNIVSILELITASEKGADLTEVDLAEAAADYLAAIGLTGDEADALKANLAADYELPDVPAEEPEAVSFTDVTEANWHYEYVAAMVEAGIVSGYPDGSFKPGDSVNWGAALKMVLAYAGYEDAAPVEGGTWASGYIALAKSEGLIDGDVEQNANITRAEMCQLLAKALKIEASENESTFPDTDDGYVVALAELGVIGGNPDGTFAPDGELTRAQLCKILAEAPAADEPAAA